MIIVAQITNGVAQSPIVTDVAKLITDVCPTVDAQHATAIVVAVYLGVKALRNRTSLGQHSFFGPVLAALNLESKEKPVSVVPVASAAPVASAQQPTTVPQPPVSR